MALVMIKLIEGRKEIERKKEKRIYMNKEQ